MPIIKEGIIKKQLEITKRTKMVFKNRKSTVLIPQRFVPRPCSYNRNLVLNGLWKVKKWPFGTDEQFLTKPEVEDSSWEDVSQPGKVFYGKPERNPAQVKNWNRVTLEHIDSEDGAILRKKVNIPEEWKGRRIFLQFNAVYPAARFYVNGKFLGEHACGLTPSQWDITDIAIAGKEIVVAVRLLRRHRFVQMDMPRHAVEFGGINQDIYLFAVEKTFVKDYHLISELNQSFKNASIRGLIRIKNTDSISSRWTIKVNLIDPETSEIVASFFKQGETLSSSSSDVEVGIDVKNPKLWNDEFPNLYRVELRLKVDGFQEQVFCYNTGFRRFEFKNERPLLNGKFVKFRGVSYLAFHPEYGLYLPKEWLRKNFSLMKKANVNAIHTHFLAPPAVAELCDEMGIYLLQELPIDWGTNYIHDPEWVGPALMRIEGGIRRDRHHPSIMVWSVGNENLPNTRKNAENGWNHLKIYDKFVKVLDPTRPTMFPPPGPANRIEGIFEVRVGDIADIHYSFKPILEYRKTGRITNPRTWEMDMEAVTKEEAMKKGWSGVWFSSEFGLFNYQPDLLNAPYLSVISDIKEDILSGKNTLQTFIDRFKYEWGLMREDPSCLGGTYFPWLCAGTGNNPWGWVQWGEDADWGIITADLLPKPSFWALRVIFSPVRFPERIIWKKGQERIEFMISNHFNSINLEDCTLRTMMGEGGKWMGQMREWKDISIKCSPGETRKINIPIWNKITLEILKKGEPAICRCILLDPKGFRVVTADIIMVPESLREEKGKVPIGPDAEL